MRRILQSFWDKSFKFWPRFLFLHFHFPTENLAVDTHYVLQIGWTQEEPSDSMGRLCWLFCRSWLFLKLSFSVKLSLEFDDNRYHHTAVFSIGVYIYNQKLYFHNLDCCRWQGESNDYLWAWRCWSHLRLLLFGHRLAILLVINYQSVNLLFGHRVTRQPTKVWLNLQFQQLINRCSLWSWVWSNISDVTIIECHIVWHFNIHFWTQ